MKSSGVKAGFHITWKCHGRLKLKNSRDYKHTTYCILGKIINLCIKICDFLKSFSLTYSFMSSLHQNCCDIFSVRWNLNTYIAMYVCIGGFCFLEKIVIYFKEEKMCWLFRTKNMSLWTACVQANMKTAINKRCYSMDQYLFSY